MPLRCVKIKTSQTPAVDTPLRPAYTAAVRIEVNGEARELPDGATVASLLAELGVGGARVAVEHNRTIVPRSEHGTVRLAEGDKLEVVTFVGGG